MSSPRFTLILPVIGNPAAFAPRLVAVLSQGGVAAVLLRPEADDKATLAVAKALAASKVRAP